MPSDWCLAPPRQSARVLMSGGEVSRNISLMLHFMVVTRLREGTPSRLETAQRIGSAVRKAGSSSENSIRWIESYAMELGSAFDFLDVFEVQSEEEVKRIVESITATGIANAEAYHVLRGLRSAEGNLLTRTAPVPAGVPDRVREASEESFPASDAPAWSRNAG